MHDKSLRTRSTQMGPLIRDMADVYLPALGYEKSESFKVSVDDGQDQAYIYSEIKKQNGAPLLWIMLSDKETGEDTALLHEFSFDGGTVENSKLDMSSYNCE